MEIGIIDGGTVARLFLEHIAAGQLGDARVIDILAPPGSAALAAEHGVRVVTGVAAELIALGPRVVVEAASHLSLEAQAEGILTAGSDLSCSRPACWPKMGCASASNARRARPARRCTCLRAGSVRSGR